MEHVLGNQIKLADTTLSSILCKDHFLKNCNSRLEESTDQLRKHITKRRNTCQNFKIADIGLIRLMTENVYSHVELKQENDVDSEDSDDADDSKIHRRNAKTRNFKTVKNFDQSHYDSEKSAYNITFQTASTSNSSNITVYQLDPKIEVNLIVKEVKKHEERIYNDEVLETLLNKYYYDITDNFNSNFENYVVNNLTIVSYLDKIMPNFEIGCPVLSLENMFTLNKLDRMKKILFVDLDETLIHSDINHEFDFYDAQIRITMEGAIAECKFNIIIRPYTKEFLTFAKERFNVILFTAGIKEYADQIIEKIDPMNEYFVMRLYRESCIEFQNFFIKDLGILATFGLKDMIILDNCIYSFARNLKNGILISSFYSDKEDCELLNVMEYLDSKLFEVKDIREVNEAFYGFEAIKNFLYEKLEKEGII